MAYKITSRKIVYVRWSDSSQLFGWLNVKRADVDGDICICESVGWLVKRTKKLIQLALNSSEDDTGALVGQTISIPTENIKKIRYL